MAWWFLQQPRERTIRSRARKLEKSKGIAPYCMLPVFIRQFSGALIVTTWRDAGAHHCCQTVAGAAVRTDCFSLRSQRVLEGILCTRRIPQKLRVPSSTLVVGGILASRDPRVTVLMRMSEGRSTAAGFSTVEQGRQKPMLYQGLRRAGATFAYRSWVSITEGKENW